jgi:conjugative transposon TraM protein
LPWGGILWYVLGGEANSQPIPNALNTTVPTALSDSTNKPGKLDLQASGNGADLGTVASDNGVNTQVPGSLDKFVYRKARGVLPTDGGTMAYMDTSIYQQPAATTRRVPTRLKATMNQRSNPLDAPLTERDGMLTGNYDSREPQADPAEAARKKQELEKALKDRQRLITLLEEYKRDKEAKIASEGDKKKVRKAETPDVVGSLDVNLKGAGNGFYGMMSDENERTQKQQLDEEVGTIRAMIYSDQDVVSSGRVKIRLMDPVTVRGIKIPVNTLIYGTCNFSAERVNVKITSIQYEDHILPVSMNVYDMDGMAGVYVPNIVGLNEMRQAAGQSTGGINITTGGGSGLNAAAMLGTSAASAAVQGAKELVQKKTTSQKAHLKSNYYVLLRSAEPGGGSGN